MILLIGKRRWQRLVDIEIKKKVLSEDFLSQPLLEVYNSLSFSVVWPIHNSWPCNVYEQLIHQLIPLQRLAVHPLNRNPLGLHLQAIDFLQQFIVCPVHVLVDKNIIKEMSIFILHFPTSLNDFLQHIILKVKILQLFIYHSIKSFRSIDMFITLVLYSSLFLTTENFLFVLFHPYAQICT